MVRDTAPIGEDVQIGSNTPPVESTMEALIRSHNRQPLNTDLTDGQLLRWNATTGKLEGADSGASKAASTDTIVYDFQRDDGAGGTQSLVQIRAQQTLSDPDTGTELGRGAIRLIDNVRPGGRSMELGFYEFGGGLFADFQTGEPFEFWIDTGVISMKGNTAAQLNSHRFEVRKPSDASGLNLEYGYKAGVATNRYGAHVYSLDPGNPLYVQTQDGTGLTVGGNGKVSFGGRLIEGAVPATVEILAGQPGQVADLIMGHWDGVSDSPTWRWRRQAASGLGLSLYYGGGTADTDGWHFSKDKNLGMRVNAYGGGQGVIALANAAAVPTSSPAAAGGILYAEAGALKWRGSAGTVTTLAPA